MTHISVDVQKVTLNASCMTILGGRIKQLDIFCRVAGFMSDFHSFIVVEHIWFFHGALQFISAVRLSHSGVMSRLGLYLVKKVMWRRSDWPSPS